MRICVGIAPQSWYEIADEAGLLLQNEWLYWQTHGWDEQLRKEYTDWIWADGSHPSIVIWDAINENWNSFVGNQLIPELKQLDPTRVWDAGYMTGAEMGLDEMDEPHPYQAGGHRDTYEKYVRVQQENPYELGNLDYWTSGQWFSASDFNRIRYSSAAQLVNEYGWVWLWRDGRPAKLTHQQFRYFLGEKLTPQACRDFQAYWTQLETEWLRAERSFAGVLAFCYLTNNYGHTGDWFVGDIKNLEQSDTLKWFKHAFAPVAVFIDLTDERYTKHMPAHVPGSMLSFNCIGINDESKPVEGSLALKVYNDSGQIVQRQDKIPVLIPEYDRTMIPLTIELPIIPGGYTLTAEFYRADAKGQPVISRRYLKIGDDKADYRFGSVPLPDR